MKPRNIVLTIGAMVVVAVGCTINGGRELRENLPTQYIISFKNVKLIAPDKFKDLLENTHPRWQRNIVIHYGGQQPDYKPGDMTDTMPAPTKAYKGRISQDGTETGNPDGLNVTQRVGLHRLEHLKALLEQVDAH